MDRPPEHPRQNTDVLVFSYVSPTKKFRGQGKSETCRLNQGEADCVSLPATRLVCLHLFLFAALSFPQQQETTANREKPPVQPEQVRAGRLEGLTQEEIREEVGAHGLASYPDIAFLSALSAAESDAETIRMEKCGAAAKEFHELPEQNADPEVARKVKALRAEGRVQEVEAVLAERQAALQ